FYKNGIPGYISFGHGRQSKDCEGTAEFIRGRPFMPPVKGYELIGKFQFIKDAGRPKHIGVAKIPLPYNTDIVKWFFGVQYLGIADIRPAGNNPFHLIDKYGQDTCKSCALCKTSG